MAKKKEDKINYSLTEQGWAERLIIMMITIIIIIIMIVMIEKRNRKLLHAFREAGERLVECTVSEAADGWI